MKTARLLILPALAAALALACDAPPAANTAANTATNASANANAAAPTGTGPTADGLLNFDKLWHEAYSNGNHEFFLGVLHDKFVMLAADGTRLDKASALKAISGTVKCELASPPALTEPLRTMIDADTYAVSYKAEFDGTCTEGGRTAKRPSPVRAGTVWVRVPGNNWKAVFHGENLIVEPGKAAPRAAAPAKPAGAASPAADPITAALMDAERSVWDAWKDRDRARLDVLLTAGDIGFVNIFGTAFGTKADALADWTGHGCSVTSVTLADGAAVSLSPTVGILTLKGTAIGTCSGQKIGPVHGTSVYIKEGPAWKWAFGFNAPAP